MAAAQGRPRAKIVFRPQGRNRSKGKNIFLFKKNIKEILIELIHPLVSRYAVEHSISPVGDSISMICCSCVHMAHMSSSGCPAGTHWLTGMLIFPGQIQWPGETRLPCRLNPHEGCHLLCPNLQLMVYRFLAGLARLQILMV